MVNISGGLEKRGYRARWNRQSLEFINSKFENLQILSYSVWKFSKIVQNMKVFKFWIDELEHLPASLEFVTAFFEFLALQRSLVQKKKFWNWLFDL